MVSVLLSLTCAGAVSADGELAGIAKRLAHFFRAGPAHPYSATVVRGRFAVVDFDAMIEGSRKRDQLLLERYSFGWQTVAFTSERFRECELTNPGVPPGDVAALLANGIATLPADSPCPTGPHLTVLRRRTKAPFSS